MKKSLTNKQEKFVQGLVKGLSQREAYKQSYNAFKMKDETIDNKAYILFKRDDIRARYEELNSKVIEKFEKKTIADATEIMEFWTKVVRGEENDYTISQEQEPVIGEDGKKKGYRTLTKVIPVPPSIKDRNKSAELLSKRYGLDKKEVENKEEEGVKISWD